MEMAPVDEREPEPLKVLTLSFANPSSLWAELNRLLVSDLNLNTFVPTAAVIVNVNLAEMSSKVTL
jgi:hypothetical protein